MNEFRYDNIERMKYRLSNDYQFTLPKDRPYPTHPSWCINWVQVSDNGSTFFYEEGYAWDGSSGPTIDSKKCQLAGLVHDGAYQLLREGVYGEYIEKDRARKYFDDTYRDMCLCHGMGKWRAWVRWAGLRLFGARSAR